MLSYQYVVETGTIVPDTADTLALVQQEYKDQLGQDLDVSPETPQGLLIAQEVLNRDNVARNNADVANQFNPNIAGGVWLDAICQLTGLSRDVATSTIVNATCAGVAGTVIPAGSIAKTAAGDEFATINAATIPATGNLSIQFKSVLTGAIACPANSLTDISTSVLGWETVNNGSAGVLGVPKQSDVSLRNLRRNTLALQGRATPESIISGLYDLDGVQSVLFRENIGNVPAVIDGKLLAAHSIYCVVQGGDNNDIAKIILGKKSDGANYNGATVVNIFDQYSGQNYDVLFDRPTLIPIKVRVTVARLSARGGILQDVQFALSEWAAGNIDSSSKLDIGVNVSPYEMAAAVNAVLAGVTVRNFEVGYLSGAFGASELPIQIWEMPTLANIDVEVVLL